MIVRQVACKGCRKIITEDLERIRDIKYIQCPYCGRTSENKYYEEDNEK